MRNDLESVYHDIRERLYQHDKKIINNNIHYLLNYFEKNNIEFDMYLGYYDIDGFVFDKLLNDDEGVTIDNGFDFVDYIEGYRSNLEFPLVVELQIMYETIWYDKENNCNITDCIFSFVEYNGNDLIYDIKEVS